MSESSYVPGRTEDLQSVPDPNLERIRRKLLRLMIISVIITLLLVGAVLAAVLYKITQDNTWNETSWSSSACKSVKPDFINTKNRVDQKIVLPSDVRLVSQSISGNLISLEILKSNGNTDLVIYDYKKSNINACLQISARDTGITKQEKID